MIITQSQAKELEKVLKDNGFDEIAEDMRVSLYKDLGIYYTQLSCVHEFISLENFVKEMRGRINIKKAFDDGELSSLYINMVCCSKCGMHFYENDDNIRNKLEKIEKEGKISIRFHSYLDEELD